MLPPLEGFTLSKTASHALDYADSVNRISMKPAVLSRVADLYAA